MKETIIIASEWHKNRVIELIRSLPADSGHVVSIKEKTRSTEQNSKMWAVLTDIANSVNWHGQYLTKEEWKDVFTASLKRQKVVPGIDNGFVVIGAHTSKMSIAEMAELIECATAFGCQHQVKWSDNRYEE
jgi:hypothetical protein